MAVERTLSIIKPDAVEHNNIGNILAMIQGAGLEILGMRMLHLSRAQAEGFYAVHRERPFFGELVEQKLTQFSLVPIADTREFFFRSK